MTSCSRKIESPTGLKKVCLVDPATTIFLSLIAPVTTAFSALAPDRTIFFRLIVPVTETPDDCVTPTSMPYQLFS